MIAAGRPTLPARLEKFYREEVGSYAGRYVYALPSAGRRRFLVTFVEPTLELFDENDISREDYPTHVPVATISGDSGFLAVLIDKPECPVAYWYDHVEFVPVAESFDDFLRSLLKKRERSPLALLAKAYKKAVALEGADARILALLEPVLARVPTKPIGDYMIDREIADAFNLVALALQKVKRRAEAPAMFERALVYDATSRAALNLMVVRLEEGDAAGVVALATTYKKRDLEPYEWTWSQQYFGQALAVLGKSDAARAAFMQIIERYRVSEPSIISEVRKRLEELVRAQGAAHRFVKDLLGDFREPTWEVVGEQAANSRAFYSSLPANWHRQLKERIGLDTRVEPTDADIARMLEVKRLVFLDDQAVHDAAPFLRFTNLRHLEFDGDVRSLEPLHALTKLRRVVFNGRMIDAFERTR